MCACGVAALLGSIALPSYRDQIVKSRRADAVAALTALQAAEERMRSNVGAYSTDLGALGTMARSEQGLYALAVELTGPESYRARALPVAGGGQGDDRECPELLLEVASGFASFGPSARCWNR
jgi:type IV pilus assembly protein PilE